MASGRSMFYLASVKKYNMKVAITILRHMDRSVANSSNKDIDRNKSDKNYRLSPDWKTSDYNYLKYLKEQVYCYNDRKDLAVLAGWIVTQPDDYTGDSRAFFNAVHNFLHDRYFEPLTEFDTEISCYVHMDESQPHLHYLFTPITWDDRNARLKMCANDILTRKDLKSFHSDLQEYLNAHGINANIHSGITKANGGNRTVKQLKKDRPRGVEWGQEREWGSIDREWGD